MMREGPSGKRGGARAGRGGFDSGLSLDAELLYPPLKGHSLDADQARGLRAIRRGIAGSTCHFGEYK